MTQTLVQKLRELDFTFDVKHVDLDIQRAEYKNVLDEYAQHPLVAQATKKGSGRLKFNDLMADLVQNPTQEKVKGLELDDIFENATTTLGLQTNYKPWVGAAVGTGAAVILGLPLLLLTAPVIGFIGYKVVAHKDSQDKAKDQQAKQSLQSDALYLDAKIRQITHV
ncbi:hypothetical protein HY837_02770 [archaeon]|nr:hypothetical protein [archaeon]